MILTDENGKRYNATCVGTHMTRDLYEIEEIAPEGAWWKQLPPNAPVEVRDGVDGWWSVCTARDASNWEHIRWPPPRDNWAYAREHGYTHIAVNVNGEACLTRVRDSWSDDVVLVPIPQLGDGDE